MKLPAILKSGLSELSESDRREFLAETLFVNYHRFEKIIWLGVAVLPFLMYFIEFRNVLGLSAPELRVVSVNHWTWLLSLALFLFLFHRRRVASPEEMTGYHRSLFVVFNFVILASVVSAYSTALVRTGTSAVYILLIIVLTPIFYRPEPVTAVGYALNFAFYLYLVAAHFQGTAMLQRIAYLTGTLATLIAWALSRYLFETRVREFEHLKTITRQSQSLDEKNAELAANLEQLRVAKEETERKKAELDQKVAELHHKNEELVASQKQANRIFSALAEALPGTVLDGKYRLDEKIGTGGFGAVFKGTHVLLGRPIAVKVFRPAAGNDSPEEIERFRREGMAACRVTHPNAVSVFDSGISSEGIAFIVMELLNGHSLAEELRQVKRLSLRRAADILKPVCDVLAEAHASGLVHRDIKPDNIFLHRDKDGMTVKVVDFGIAKLVEGEHAEGVTDLTVSGGIIGTPLYMAPERLNAGTYDGRSDVYSLGVMLYQMLCGRLPFESTGKGIVEMIMEKMLRKQPPSLRKYVPTIPEEVEMIVLSALQSDPEARPTALGLATAFGQAVSECPLDIQTAVSRSDDPENVMCAETSPMDMGNLPTDVVSRRAPTTN